MRINKFIYAKINHVLSLVIILISFFFYLNNTVFSQNEIQQKVNKQEFFEAVVVKVLEEKQIKPVGSPTSQLY